MFSGGFNPFKSGPDQSKLPSGSYVDLSPYIGKISA